MTTTERMDSRPAPRSARGLTQELEGSFRCVGSILAFVEQFFDFGGIFSERHDRFGQSDKDERAWIADTALNPILQLAPVCGGSAEFVADKMIDPRISKRNRIFLSLNSLHDVSDLSTRPVKTDPFHVAMRIDFLVIDKASDKSFH